MFRNKILDRNEHEYVFCSIFVGLNRLKLLLIARYTYSCKIYNLIYFLNPVSFLVFLEDFLNNKRYSINDMLPANAQYHNI